MFAVTVLGGSAVTLGFVLAPLIAGVTDPLDPRRFTVFGLPPLPLAGVLGVLGFVSVPTFVLAAFSACAAVVWVAHGASWGVAVLGAVLQVTTCVLIARVFLALTSMFLAERRSRELSGLFALTILVVVVPVAVFLASLEWNGVVPTQLTEAAETLAITPLGAAVAFPGLLAAGSADASLSLLVALGTIVVLAAVWVWLVHRILTTTERPVSTRERGGLGWFAVAPGTPGGAIAARSLIYWLGDRRYLANLIVIPIAAGLTVVPLVIAGVPLGDHRPRPGAAGGAVPRLASAQRPGVRLDRGLDALRGRHPGLLGSHRAPRADPPDRHSDARDRHPVRDLGARSLGAPPRDGGRVRVAVPDGTRALEHLVRRLAVCRQQARGEPVPAAAAGRLGERDHPVVRHARSARAERARPLVGVGRR